MPTHRYITIGKRMEGRKETPVPKVSKPPTTSTQPDPSSTKNMVDMSSAPRKIPKSRSSHHPSPRWNPKSEKDRRSRKRPASHTLSMAATRPATPLASGIAGESAMRDRPPETASDKATARTLNNPVTSTLKTMNCTTNRQSARIARSGLRPALVSTALRALSARSASPRLSATLRPFRARFRPKCCGFTPTHTNYRCWRRTVSSLPARTETTGRKRGEAEALPTSEGPSPSVPTSDRRERADERSPQGRSVPSSGAPAPELDRVVDGFPVVAYHLLEGVDLVEGPSAGAAPHSEPVLEEGGCQQDTLVVGCELIQVHDGFVGADGALPCLGRVDLDLGSAGDAFYAAFQAPQAGEDFVVRRPVGEVGAPEEVADLRRLVYDDDGGQRDATFGVPHAEVAG